MRNIIERGQNRTARAHDADKGNSGPLSLTRNEYFQHFVNLSRNGNVTEATFYGLAAIDGNYINRNHVLSVANHLLQLQLNDLAIYVAGMAETAGMRDPQIYVILAAAYSRRAKITQALSALSTAEEIHGTSVPYAKFRKDLELRLEKDPIVSPA